jgi:CHAT domain-containing protein/tetratricopeptide (TPR) repeat protein
MRRALAGAVVLLLGPLVAPAAAPPAPPRNLTALEQKEVDGLQARLYRHFSAGELEQAARLAEQMAALRARAQGPRHWQAIDARFEAAWYQQVVKVPPGDRPGVVRANYLGSQGVNLLNRGRPREAEKPLRESLALHLKVLGEQHSHTATRCANLAECLGSQGKQAEALLLHRRALDIRLRVHGKRHPDTARSYNEVAGCLLEQGKPREALPLFRRALDIRLEVLGKRHPDTAVSCHNLAFCLERQGKPEDALPLYRRALAIYLEVHGERHPLTAIGYNNVAACLDSQGKAGDALPLYRRALAVYLGARGERHRLTAIGYNNVAACLASQGKHGEALRLYRRALAVQLQVQGEQHPETALSYNNLAFCLSRQGKHGEALPLHRRALAIQLQVQGEQHPDTAMSYDNLASCLSAQGKYGEALPLFRRALGIYRKAQGERHPETAKSYHNVAACLDKLGKHAEALTLYRRALDVFLLLHGEWHPSTATSDNNLASCLHSLGRLAEALTLYRRALDVRLRVLGEQHPDTAAAANNVAVCLASLGRRVEGLRLLQASLPGQEVARFHGAATGFDRATAATSHASPHAMLAAGLAALGQPVNAYRHAEHALARGLLDDLSSVPPADRDRLTALGAEVRALEVRLVPLLARANLSDEEKALRDQLQSRRGQLEGELGRLASAASARQVLPLESIQRRIPADAALVLWVDELGEHLGCVIRRHGPPAWVRLPGSGKDGAWTAGDISLPVRCHAALADPSTGEALRQALYRQRLAPLEGHLKGARRLLVVPTGAMAAVPVEALTDRWQVSYVPSGSAFARAAERSRPARLSPALVLADPAFSPTPGRRPPAPAHGLLVKAVLPGGVAARLGLRPGDVLLEYGGKALKAPTDLRATGPEERVPLKLWREGKLLAGRVPGGKLGVAVDRRAVAEALAAWRDEQSKVLASTRGQEDLLALAASSAGLLATPPAGGPLLVAGALFPGRASEVWPPLPGTRLEARSLEALLGSATVLLGSAASEQALEGMATSGKLKGFRLLHLATHGLADPDRPRQSALVLAQDRLPSAREQEARVLKDRRPIEGRLTVDAVLSDWKLDCDLVVLSACQSGLGQDARGEGMLGFAQALLQAGARSVVLSRWKVDDAATALLMARFYQNLLGKRDGLKAPMRRAQALQEAKRWLRGLPRAEAQKRLAALVDGVPRGERGKVRPALPTRRPGAEDDRPFAHPYYWAAFVLIGDPD